MKISSLYLNSLLAGLVVLLTFVLVLLYMMQSDNKIATRYTSGPEPAPATYAEIEDIEAQITALENLVEQEKISSAKQQSAQAGHILKLKEQLSDTTKQLESSRTTAQQAQEQLDQKSDLLEQLGSQLESKTIRSLEQKTTLASSSKEIEILGKNLQQEKDFILSLRMEHEADKLKLAGLADELDQKKRQLIRNKRELSRSNQALASKDRELTISKGKISDVERKNALLNRKISILSNEAKTIRQTSRDQSLVASPNS